MKDRILIFIIALAGGLAGANVQPVLTGAGKLLFPENATPATISASSGALTVKAGGSNQNINLTPSGTGWTDNASTFRATGVHAPGSGVGVEVAYDSGVPTGAVNSFDRGGSVFKPMRVNGNTLTLNAQSAACVGVKGACTFDLDTTGDTNTSGVFRKGGTAGVGTGSTVTVCSTVAAGPPASCSSSCTLVFNGGIRTGGSCP